MDGDEQLEWVKSKIEKLLLLASNNSNLDEAATAAKHAQRLMTKYAIDQASIAIDKDDGEDEVPQPLIGSITAASGKRLASWRVLLANVIGRHNQCRALILRYETHTELQFVGLTNDTRLCLALFAMLESLIDRMAKDYLRIRVEGRGRAKAVGNSYRLGAVHAIHEKMQEAVAEEKAAAMSNNPNASRALARLDDINVRIDEYIGRATHTKLRTSALDAQAWHAGHADGKRIDLSRPDRKLKE